MIVNFVTKHLEPKQRGKHLKINSFKRVIKCENCSFLATNNLSLNVHEGKAHSGEFGCRLWGFEAGNLETLEMHLHTCEIYTCCRSDDIVRTVSDIKKHLKEKHASWLNDTYVTHSKISRTDSDMVETKNVKGIYFFSKN